MDEDKDPFLEGVKGYNQYESNPYPLGSIDRFAWDRGYSERKHGYVDEYGFYKDDEDE